MKLGIVGKGGVGKTTVAALVARTYAQRGARVLCVETDSNPNLGTSLGLSPEEAEAVPAVPRAVLVGAGGDLTVDEVLERYGRPTPAGPTLLSALAILQAGGGCTCSGHATVRTLLGDVEGSADVTVVDMEAGLEHLSRAGGTLAYADTLVAVMEPTRKSVLTTVRTRALAEELGIPRLVAVGNKARDGDVEFFAEAAAQHGLELAAVVPADPAVVDADRRGTPITAAAPPAVEEAIDRLVDALG